MVCMFGGPSDALLLLLPLSESDPEPDDEPDDDDGVAGRFFLYARTQHNTAATSERGEWRASVALCD